MAKFTLDFMAKFDIESNDGRAILQLVMLLANVDTSKIECWHAWTRRVVSRLGVQTHRPSYYDVSARCFAHRSKRRAADQAPWMDGTPSIVPQTLGILSAQAGDEGGACERPAKRARGGGGAWRAHVSASLKAGQKDFKAIGDSYHSRSESAVQEDLEEGQAATLRH